MIDNDAPGSLKKKHIIIILILFSLIILCASYIYYRYEENTILNEKYNELKAIADLKINQIVQWQKDRIADAVINSGSTFFTDAVEQYILTKSNKSLEGEIFQRLSLINGQYEYENILLADTNNTILLSITGKSVHLDKSIYVKTREAARTQQITSTDFYFCGSNNNIHYDIISPIVNRNKQTIAVLIMRCDPEAYLFPLIQSWPTPSKTSETILLRKDGNSVLYLNELRHKKNTVLKLRMPLTRKEIPAVQAALGFTGVFSGKDYRGVDVLAYITSVPGTPWSMVAKVDKSEILGDLNYKAFSIIIVCVLMLLFLWSGLAFIYNSKQKNIFRKLWQLQEEARTTLYSIGDGVLITDEKGFVKQLNPIAEQLTGWTEKEASGKPLEEIFDIIHEENRLKVDNPVKKVLREGVIVELANHTLLISKDGKETPIADSGAPIKNQNGDIQGAVLVFRDQTKERAKKKIIEESEAKYKSLFSSTNDGICLHEIIFDAGGNPVNYIILDVNKKYEELTDIIKENVINKKATEIYKSKTAPYLDIYARVALTGEPYCFETFFEPMNKHFAISVYSPGKGKFATVFQDITVRKQAEENLRRRVEEVETLMEVAPVAIYVSDDAEGKVIRGNREANRLFESGGSENLSASTTAVRRYFRNGTELKPEELPMQEASAKNIEIRNSETELLLPNGRLISLLGSASPLHDVNGNVRGSIGVFMDVTERKNTEKELRASEARFRKTFEDSAVGIEHILPSGEWLRVNNKVCEILGYPKEELITLNYKSITHSDDLPKEIELKQRLLSREIQNFSIEKRYFKKDGSIIWATLNCSLMQEPENNQTYIVSIIEDITDRKKIEEARLESEAKLLEAQRLAHMCSFTFDFLENSFEWTEEFSNIYEIDPEKKFYSIEEMMQFVHPDDRDYVKASVKKAIDGKDESLQMEYRIITGRGNLKYVNYRGKLFFNSQGQHTKRFGTIIDITERKLYEMELKKTLDELQRSNRDLEQFAYVASHDLQEPIRMIKSYTELLRRRYAETMDSDEEEFFGYISDGATRMHELVNALLGYSRLVSKEKVFENVDCNDIVTDVLKDLKTAIEETKASIICKELPKVKGNKVLLRQLFQNLIQNAIKFRDKRHPEVIISSERKNKYLMIKVKDNGIGIAPEYYEKIFVIFQKLHTREQYPGTGIGLAVCKKIVELHGGQIYVDSAVGKGTTFSFTLQA